MADRANLRASDADRERVAERLRKATGEGRLLAEELEERLHAALSARTYGELDAVVADLPDEARPHRPAPLAPVILEPGPGTLPIGQTTNGLAIASLVLGFFWVWGVGSLLAIVFGLLARREINRSKGRETGGGLAVAGITLGALGLAGVAVMVIFAIVRAAAHHVGVG